MQALAKSTLLMTHLVAISVEEDECMVGGKVLKLQHCLGPPRHHCSHEFIHEVIVCLAFDTWLTQTHVEGIGHQL